MNCTKFYIGKLGEEKLLFSTAEEKFTNFNKNDFIYYNNVIYKILYIIYDFNYKKCDVFVREAIEEDF